MLEKYYKLYIRMLHVIFQLLFGQNNIWKVNNGSVQIELNLWTNWNLVNCVGISVKNKYWTYSMQVMGKPQLKIVDYLVETTFFC